MSRVADIVHSIKTEPFIAIEMIWGIALILDGIYLLLPNYEAAAGSVLITFVTSPYVSIGVAMLYIIVGILAMAASYYNRFREISTFLLFLVFLFTVLIRLLSVGITPTTWVWPALLAVTAGLDYWRLKWNRYST